MIDSKLKLILGIIAGLLFFTVGGAFVINEVEKSFPDPLLDFIDSPTGVSLGAPTKPKTQKIVDVVAFIEANQEALKSSYDRYITITKEGRILHKGVPVDEYKGWTIPDGIQVVSWKSVNGEGFQIIYETDTTIQSWGFGPDPEEVQSRIWGPLDLPIQDPKTASST